MCMLQHVGMLPQAKVYCWVLLFFLTENILNGASWKGGINALI